MAEKTPVERAGEAIYCAPGGVWPWATPLAKVALTAAVADREGLEEVIAKAQNVPFVGPKQRKISDAVARWLTGEEA